LFFAATAPSVSDSPSTKTPRFTLFALDLGRRSRFATPFALQKSPIGNNLGQTTQALRKIDS
jgi:hypothetical protein